MLGENLERAVRRIAVDETGLKVKPIAQLGTLEYSARSAFGQAISVVYLADGISGFLSGNTYGPRVRTFKELPSRMIVLQRNLVRSLKDFVWLC